jgi:cysteine synthase A
MIYENILKTIGKTPIVKINRLAPPGIEMYVKIESFNPMASIKDRLALAVIEDAEKSGKLKPGMTVVEATSGNTGIALAMVCAAKGYPFVATMAESFSIGMIICFKLSNSSCSILERRKLMKFLGAKVVLTPKELKGSGMVAKAKELSEKHGYFLTSQFSNPANPAFHRSTTASEILSDFAGLNLTHFVSGWGTGKTFYKFQY